MSGDESVDLHGHPIVEPRQRNDGKNKQRKTKINYQKNGYSGSPCPSQRLDDLASQQVSMQTLTKNDLL